MALTSVPIETNTTHLDVQLLDTLRMFMRNYPTMNQWEREIVFEVLRECIKKSSPIEVAYLENKKLKASQKSNSKPVKPSKIGSLDDK